MSEKQKLNNANRKVERPAGLLAIIISFFVVAAIFTQMDIEPEITNIHEDLLFLQESIQKLNVNAFIWLINSILIIILGPSILITFLPHGRSSSYIAAFLITATGITYLLYAGAGFSIIYLVRELFENSDNESQLMISVALYLLITKTNLQLISYTLTGVSSIILGQLIARTGYLPRFIGWMAIVCGLIYATYGWINMDSLVFTAGRILFVLSLMIFGSYLLLRGLSVKKKTVSRES
jgi:hypothetical protein